jgi:electron transport complex protein RnfC
MILKGNKFPGGIHPFYGKEFTQGGKTEVLPLPDKVVIPLSQHIGAPCKPLVAVGALVKKGELIGETSERVTAPIHASISGKVTHIGPSPHPGGNQILSITIESDKNDEWIGGFEEHPDYLDLDLATLRAIITRTGVVGLGGAAFPTHVKLNPPKDKNIHTLILNGVECEPYLTADHRIMVEQPKEVIEGLKILTRILGVQKAYIGIEDNKPDALRIMEEAVKQEGSRLVETRVVELETKYPQGGEKQLIQAILGLEVPYGGLPMDLGVVVQNVGTAAAIYEAVRYGRPLIDRIITITGRGVVQPKNLRVRIGTQVRDILNFCGGFAGEPGKVIMGGPMMGPAQYTLDVPIVKGTGGILVFPKEEVSIEESRACIRCCACIEACPVGLLPNMLSVTAEVLNFTEAKKYHPLACIECGCCSYVCPSRRPIVHQIRHIKMDLASNKKKVVMVS